MKTTRLKLFFLLSLPAIVCLLLTSPLYAQNKDQDLQEIFGVMHWEGDDLRPNERASRDEVLEGKLFFNHGTGLVVAGGAEKSVVLSDFFKDDVFDAAFIKKLFVALPDGASYPTEHAGIYAFVLQHAADIDAAYKALIEALSSSYATADRHEVTSETLLYLHQNSPTQFEKLISTKGVDILRSLSNYKGYLNREQNNDPIEAKVAKLSQLNVTLKLISKSMVSRQQ